MTYTEMKKFLKLGNYFFIPNDIFFYDLTPRAFIVYCYLCKCSDNMGQSFPSRKNIGDNCHIKEKTVDKAISELVDAGLLDKEHRFNENTHLQTSNGYAVRDIDDKKKILHEVFKELEKEHQKGRI